MCPFHFMCPRYTRYKFISNVKKVLSHMGLCLSPRENLLNNSSLILTLQGMPSSKVNVKAGSLPTSEKNQGKFEYCLKISFNNQAI